MMQWLSFGNHELLPTLSKVYLPLLGTMPYNKKAVETAEGELKIILKYIDSYLLHHTYFVGERITLADILITGILDRGFQYVLSILG
jgi:elongation factor 1-gamma